MFQNGVEITDKDEVVVNGTNIKELWNNSNLLYSYSSAPPPPESVKINEPFTELVIGQTKQYTATVLPAEANQSVKWKVSNKAVGTIDATTGLFTALAVGSNAITAESVVNNKGSVPKVVTVVAPPKPDPVSIEGMPTNLTKIAVGASYQINASVLPAEADQTLTFTSSNENYGTVTASGLVTRKASGSLNITATATNGINANTIFM